MRRAPVFRTLAAACTSAALLSGCGTDEDLGKATEGGGDTRSSVQTAPPADPAVETAQTATVVFQMTGLMLVVPTQTAGGQTHVLLPKVTRHPDPHVARFAFGLPQADADLCKPYRGGVCWVDLKNWRMEPIGGGGEPRTSRAFPDTIVNVTRATGNKHRVKLDTPEQDLVAHLRLQAGTLGDAPCSLARWRYTPAGQTTEVTSPFANRITWEIRHPLTTPLTLRFIRKSDGLRKTVQLGTTTSGRVHVLLAHVPNTELPDLESGQSTGSPTDTEPLHHLHDLYDHLRDQAGQQARTRPIPVYVGKVGERCPVVITLFGVEKSLVRLFRDDGIKTYGCVVGTGV